MGVTPVPPASISTCLHAIARSPTPNVPAVYAIRPVGPGRPQRARVGGVPHSPQVRRAGGQQQREGDDRPGPDAARVGRLRVAGLQLDRSVRSGVADGALWQRKEVYIHNHCRDARPFEVGQAAE
jgi:hypothetical protein